MRRAAFVTGCAVLAVIWIGLLPASDRASFTVHMVAHMGVVAAAAPLVALGLSGSRADLVSNSRWFSPVVASAAELLAVWIWHLPGLRSLSETSALAAASEQLTFFVAGTALWLACLGGVGTKTHERRLAGACGLLFTSMHMTLLGALLALSSRPLYGEAEVSCLGVSLSAAVDQQVGGVVMLLVGAAVYLAGGVSLLASTLNVEQAPEPLRRRG